MYKSVFQNSKAALVFAGMTIFGAVAMVGSPDDKGVLNKAVDRFSDEREMIVEDARQFAETHSVGDVPPAPDAGWGSSDQVFGEYASGNTTSAPVAKGPTGSVAAIIPGPQPVVADNEGIPVSPDGEGQTAFAPAAPPVITSRQMVIEPR
jgi:hypothetical protein